jgi:Zn-finger nucleic acid-binding protein
MKCPNCDGTLQMSEKQGVEIDYCPNCRGIWLDKGEFEKIIERTGEHYSKRENYESDYKKYHYGDDDDYYKKQRHPHKKKSFLDGFFDF